MGDELFIVALRDDDAAAYAKENGIPARNMIPLCTWATTPAHLHGRVNIRYAVTTRAKRNGDLTWILGALRNLGAVEVFPNA